MEELEEIVEFAVLFEAVEFESVVFEVVVVGVSGLSLALSKLAGSLANPSESTNPCGRVLISLR